MKVSLLPQPQNLLVLVLLAIASCYTALSAFITLPPIEAPATLLLTKAQYAGFGAVVACGLTYVAARRFFKRGLGITLLLAVFHVVSFLPISFNLGLGFGALPVGIEPFALLVLMGYYRLNRASANTFIHRYLLPAPTPAKAASLRREAIEQFKENFARKTDDSLRQIVQERKLVADAVAAAQELLRERNAATAPAS